MFIVCYLVVVSVLVIFAGFVFNLVLHMCNVVNKYIHGHSLYMVR